MLTCLVVVWERPPCRRVRIMRGAFLRRRRGAPHSLDHDTEAGFGPMRDDCLIWKWGKTALGYGVLKLAGRPTYAHRYFYEQTKGPIPEGVVLDHLCERPSCCNPGHLRPVPQQVNVATYYSNHRRPRKC